MNKLSKKAQEEMVGLVVIMIIVALIFLIFLGITIRKDSDFSTPSTDIYQFLDSLSEYTTDCSLDGGFSFKQIDSLAVSCEQGSRCGSGDYACEVLAQTVSAITNSSWNFDPESAEKNYKFLARFPSAPEIILSNGNFTECSSIRGAEKTFSGINISLEICYS